MSRSSHSQCHFLIPKWSRRPFVPALPDPAALSWLAGKLGQAERRALRQIVEGADLIDVHGRTYLLAPVTAETIDALASFEAEGEDREDDLCDEADDGEEDDRAA